MKSLKAVLVLAILLVLVAGCGYRSKENELVGQVKKVSLNTPIICSDYTTVDISLGVIRNGVGSMSSQDMWLYVPDRGDKELLIAANASGALVKVIYGEKRFTPCSVEAWVSKVELVK